MQAEPFYTSIRFWTSVLTPVIVALIEYVGQSVPAVKQLPTEIVTTIAASVVVMAVTFVIARTVRNTKLSSTSVTAVLDSTVPPSA